jgi:hypothetical protein
LARRSLERERIPEEDRLTPRAARAAGAGGCENPSVRDPEESAAPRWRRRLHEIVFESETRAGRVFDLGVLVACPARGAESHDTDPRHCKSRGAML